MKRKNLFLFSVLVLFSYLTFFYVSCFSGLTDETGEVSFTFTEPMLTKIMSRDAGSDISDLMSGLGDLNFAPQNVKYQFTGYSSGIDEATQTPNSFILYLYEGGAYELYSLNIIQSISADFGKELSQIFSGQVSNFSELFKNALISKGEWIAASNYIDITEQQYRSSAATSGDLINVSSTVSIRFLLSKNVFDFDSHGGYHITFYNISTNYSDFPYEDEEDYGEGDDIPKIRVELTSGGKTYTEVAEIVQVEYAALGHAWFESPDMPDGQEKTYSLLAYSDGSYKIHELEDGRFKVEKAFVNPSLEFFIKDDKFIIKINKTYYPLQISSQEGEQTIFDFYRDWKSFSLKRVFTTDNSRLYEVHYLTMDNGVISANEFIFTGED